jgi:hypothetical protein
VLEAVVLGCVVVVEVVELLFTSQLVLPPEIGRSLGRVLVLLDEVLGETVLLPDCVDVVPVVVVPVALGIPLVAEPVP